VRQCVEELEEGNIEKELILGGGYIGWAVGSGRFPFNVEAFFKINVESTSGGIPCEDWGLGQVSPKIAHTVSNSQIKVEGEPSVARAVIIS